MSKEKETKEIAVRCSSDQYMTFSDLIPFEDNPRELTDSGFKKLKKSLLELGVFKPFLVWKQGNRIIGGNQRYAVIHALAEEGYQVPPLPVTMLDVPEGVARLIVLRDNQSDGDWAYEQLAEYIADLEKFGVDKALSGFGDREFEDLKKLIQTPEQLRESLEKIAGDDDTEEMMTKKFGVSFKVPDEDWQFFQSVMKKIKAETGTDEVWPNLKFLMSKTYQTESYGGMEPAEEEDDGFEHEPDLDEPDPEPIPVVKAKQIKVKRGKSDLVESDFPA